MDSSNPTNVKRYHSPKSLKSQSRSISLLLPGVSILSDKHPISRLLTTHRQKLGAAGGTTTTLLPPPPPAGTPSPFHRPRGPAAVPSAQYRRAVRVPCGAAAYQHGGVERAVGEGESDGESPALPTYRFGRRHRSMVPAGLGAGAAQHPSMATAAAADATPRDGGEQQAAARDRAP